MHDNHRLSSVGDLNDDMPRYTLTEEKMSGKNTSNSSTSSLSPFENKGKKTLHPRAQKEPLKRPNMHQSLQMHTNRKRDPYGFGDELLLRDENMQESHGHTIGVTEGLGIQRKTQLPPVISRTHVTNDHRGGTRTVSSRAIQIRKPKKIDGSHKLTIMPLSLPANVGAPLENGKSLNE